MASSFNEYQKIQQEHEDNKLRGALHQYSNNYDFWESQSDKEVLDKIFNFVKSKECGKYWQSQQSVEKVDIDKLRKRFYNFCSSNYEYADHKTYFDFFLPHLQPAKEESDAVEFAEWLRSFQLLEKINNKWVLESQITTEELYKKFTEFKTTTKKKA